MSFENWGLIPYQESLEKQVLEVSDIFQKQTYGKIIFCQHPEIVTLGRNTQSEDVYAWTGDTLEVSRGGRATYHGPQQLVIYPLINLKYPKSKNHVQQDVVGHIRWLEKIICAWLEKFNLTAYGKTNTPSTSDFYSYSQSHSQLPLQLQDTGVWVNTQKIASIGIAVKNWITYHGAAINVYHDPQAFRGMKPCGYENTIMTSLEKITGKKINLNSAIEDLENLFSRSPD